MFKPAPWGRNYSPANTEGVISCWNTFNWQTTERERWKRMRGKVWPQVSDPAQLNSWMRPHLEYRCVSSHQRGAVPGAGKQLCTVARDDWSEQLANIHLKISVFSFSLFAHPSQSFTRNGFVFFSWWKCFQINHLILWERRGRSYRFSSSTSLRTSGVGDTKYLNQETLPHSKEKKKRVRGFSLLLDACGKNLVQQRSPSLFCSVFTTQILPLHIQSKPFISIHLFTQ